MNINRGTSGEPAATMIDVSRRNLHTLLLLTVPVAVMVGLVAVSPTLYRIFCAVTGYGGTVQRAEAPAAGGEADPAALPTLTVSLDANVGRGLPWRFGPVQRNVEVKPGEPVLVHYYAENLADRPIVAQATFNVTPFKAAPYFFKTECFCFTEQKLDPGERVEMPVQFFVDPELLKDPLTKEVRRITLSYTFYPQPDDPETLARASDLGEVARDRAEAIARGETGPFVNDARRR
jgi:cytochrome c oxidase assembly protein subunit 11